MYTDNEKSYSFRNLLIKIFIILVIIIILIWIVPKFLSYKKGPNSTKKVASKTSNTVLVSKVSSSALRKLEKAGLKYYKKENVPTEESKSVKVTLKDLKKDGYITDLKSNNKVCDKDSSYVMLTKNKDDYTMKSYLKCGSSKDYILSSVGEYSYCGDSYLCKKNNAIKTDDDKDKSKDDNNNNNNSDNNTNNNSSNGSESKSLGEFGSWSEYVRTSCDTKEVVCNKDDSNCLQEVKLYSRNEIVGTKTITNTFDHTALKYVSTKTQSVCSSYNYYVINNTIFRTRGNYGEILQLGKTSTSSWSYKCQISTTTTPRFGGNEYYKYVGTQNGTHYFDYYKYNLSMEKVSSFTYGCTNTTTGNVIYYSVYKQPETYKTTENVYATACYKSVRNRISK